MANDGVTVSGVSKFQASFFSAETRGDQEVGLFVLGMVVVRLADSDGRRHAGVRHAQAFEHGRAQQGTIKNRCQEQMPGMQNKTAPELIENKGVGEIFWMANDGVVVSGGSKFQASFFSAEMDIYRFLNWARKAAVTAFAQAARSLSGTGSVQILDKMSLKLKQAVSRATPPSRR